MKNLLNRLLDALNIGGRDWIILILSLLLAFSVWLIHNLSLKYNADLKAKVVAVAALEGHEGVSFASQDVAARGRATGYNIISSYIRSRRSVKVAFNTSALQRYDDERFFVTGEKLMEHSHLIFGEDVTVDHYITDTLFFRFPRVNHKKVPVVPVTLFSFQGQYMNRGDLKVTPDSVIVEGEPYLLESVRQVFTKPIRHFDISENINGVIPVERIKGVNIPTSEIYYELDVTRYVEIEREAVVTAVNVPAEKKLMIFPSVVTVKMRCEFPLIEDIRDNIVLQVDYEDFKASLKGNCAVRPAEMPKGVISYEVSPAFVRCVEESR